MHFNNNEQHRNSLKGGSRSFFAASLVLPKCIAEPATVLYAFCRAADDAIDESEDPSGAYEMLAARLDAIYAGSPHDDPVDRDFARLVQSYNLPRALPDALLDGFLWDAQGRQYETLDDLLAYATRVAGSVGVMMAVLMGVRDQSTLSRAANLGVAMQLTNVARDVAEDAARGRVYLPARWLRDAGIDPVEWHASPGSSEALRSVIARLLALADHHYALGGTGVAGLPRSCRFGVHAARLLYAEIGRELERRGLDPFRGRAIVPGATKLRVLGRAASAAVLQTPADHRPPLAQTAFLIDAVLAHAVSRDTRPAGVSYANAAEVEQPRAWALVFEVLSRLEREERQFRGTWT